MAERCLTRLHDRASPPLIMGILNLTPDSFSDVGRHVQLEAALNQAELMVAEGAEIIDLGGESTRPGALPVTADEQCRRVLPTLSKLKELLPADVALSIDTRSPVVARAALNAGACIINDVSGGRDPAMLELAATHGAALVLMHMRGDPATMQSAPHYEDVAALARHLAKHYPERCLWASNWPHPNQHPAPSSAALLSLLPDFKGEPSKGSSA